MSNFAKPNKNPSRLKELREFPAIGGEEEQLPMPYQGKMQFGTSAPADDFAHFKLTAEEEAELKQARADKLTEKPVPPQMRTRIEYLADIGRMTKDVKIGENTFTLRTLKSKENKAVLLTLVDAANRVDEAYGIKFHTLARAILRLDGQPFEHFVGDKGIAAVISVLEEMEDGVTDKLFNEYLELKSSSDASFAIKDDSDLKEVSEALGK